MSELDQIFEWTEETGCASSVIKPMTKKEVIFMGGMVVSEILECLQTVTETNDEAKEIMKELLNTDFKKDYKKPDNEDKLIAEQLDAAADIVVYVGNAVARGIGMKMGPVVDEVMSANLRKKFPDGTYHKRPEDGKIIKPEGWTEPNVLALVEVARKRQREEREEEEEKAEIPEPKAAKTEDSEVPQ